MGVDAFFSVLGKNVEAAAGEMATTTVGNPQTANANAGEAICSTATFNADTIGLLLNRSGTATDIFCERTGENFFVSYQECSSLSIR